MKKKENEEKPNMRKKDTYIAGQTIHNRIEYDEHGNQIRTQKVIYEQKEFVEGYTDVKLPTKHKFNNGGFITVFQQAMRAIATDGNLSKSEYALLLWLLGTAGVDGSVEVNLDIIVEDLQLSKPSVSRALKGLTQRNIVIRKDGNRYDRTPLPMELSFNYDQLNYNLAYNGKTSQFKSKRSEHPELEIQHGNCWVGIQSGEVKEETTRLKGEQPLFSDYEEIK